MNPFNPDCIARGLVAADHLSDGVAEEAARRMPKIFVAARNATNVRK